MNSIFETVGSGRVVRQVVLGFYDVIRLKIKPVIGKVKLSTQIWWNLRKFYTNYINQFFAGVPDLLDVSYTEEGESVKFILPQTSLVPQLEKYVNSLNKFSDKVGNRIDATEGMYCNNGGDIFALSYDMKSARMVYNRREGKFVDREFNVEAVGSINDFLVPAAEWFREQRRKYDEAFKKQLEKDKNKPVKNAEMIFGKGKGEKQVKYLEGIDKINTLKHKREGVEFIIDSNPGLKKDEETQGMLKDIKKELKQEEKNLPEISEEQWEDLNLLNEIDLQKTFKNIRTRNFERSAKLEQDFVKSLSSKDTRQLVEKAISRAKKGEAISFRDLYRDFQDLKFKRTREIGPIGPIGNESAPFMIENLYKDFNSPYDYQRDLLTAEYKTNLLLDNSPSALTAAKNRAMDVALDGAAGLGLKGAGLLLGGGFGAALTAYAASGMRKLRNTVDSATTLLEKIAAEGENWKARAEAVKDESEKSSAEYTLADANAKLADKVIKECKKMKKRRSKKNKSPIENTDMVKIERLDEPDDALMQQAFAFSDRGMIGRMRAGQSSTRRSLLKRYTASAINKAGIFIF